MSNMVRVLCCLSVCALSVSGQLNISVFNVEKTKEEKDLSFCLRNIIEDIVKHEEFIIDVILMNIHDVLHIHTFHGLKGIRFITKTFKWIETRLYNRMYIIYCVDFAELKSGMKQAMEDYLFNPRAYFIIVMQNFNDKMAMTKFLVFNNIYNITILTMDENGYAMYTFDSPIHPCNFHETLVAISHCSNYSGGSYIFPVIEDIRGCRFKIMTYNFFPLINFDDADEEGTGQRLIHLFEEDAGIKIELIQYSKIDKLGRLVGNFTYTDILDKVVASEVEGAIGGYFMSIGATRKFSFGYPLTIDHMAAVLPRSDFLDTWQAVFEQAYFTVFLIFFLLIIFSVSAYTLSLFSSTRPDLLRDIFIVFGYFLNKTTVRKFKTGLPESLIIGSLLFAVFIIPYTMQAFMCSIKTHPIRGYEPKEFLEVERNYKLIVPSEWLKSGLGSAKNRKDCDFRLECLMKVKNLRDKKYYTIIAIELYKTYQWMLADEQCNLRLYKIKEPVGTLMRTVYFRRGSVLTKPFDNMLFKVVASGLIDHHFKEIIFRSRLKCKSQYMPNIVPLEVKDLKTIIYVFLGGFLLSAVCFAFEILSRK